MLTLTFMLDTEARQNNKVLHHRSVEESDRMVLGCAAGKTKPNVHTKLMRNYKDIPAWWFWAMLFGNTCIALVLMLVWPDIFQLPWWGVIMGFGMSVLFTLPIGVLVATTNRVKQTLILIVSFVLNQQCNVAIF